MADAAEAQALAINGTPSFVLGPTRSQSAKGSHGGQVSGEVIVGSLPWAEFKRAIQAALAKSP
jgi:protein-disulfide isomerase